MKIGIVNDLPIAVEALRRVVALEPQHQIIWVAPNGAEAMELCAKATPDLILMDLIMPGMGGVEATRRIMASTPCAILVVTVSVGANAAHVFEAMGYGALDAVDTPALGSGNPRETAASLLAKIGMIGKLIGDKNRIPIHAERGSGASPASRQSRLVAIGASAGGPAALAKVLSGLPKNFPASIVVIQHVDEQFASGMAEWLSQQSVLPVRVDRLAYTPEPSDYIYRPSVDVFFQSVNLLWPGEVVGVLLTGMGRDGALGLKALRNKGHYTIAQDQASSAVYGMPKAAAEAGAAVDILPLERIAPKLVNVLRCKH